MKKINLVLITCLILSFTFSCSKKVGKPKLTISEYETQAAITKGVVEKIMRESDHKKMHEIALAVESSRAVNCVMVSEECNLLGEILNKIVSATQSGMPKEADNVQIYNMIHQLDQELKIGKEKLNEQWAEYHKVLASESK